MISPRTSMQSKANIGTGGGVAEASDVEFIDDQPGPRRESSNKKRRKSGKKSINSPAGTIQRIQRPRGRGKLRMLPEMPLDILFDIFSLLEPEDILRLSRTTKALRDVLMRRSAISIWRKGFLHDPLPQCPEDMNEPQYANLAFSLHCHYCLSSGIHRIFWVFRVRCCDKCITKHFGEIHEILRQFSGGPIAEYTDLLCHVSLDHKPRKPRTGPLIRKLYSCTETKEINQQLINFQNNDGKLKEFIEQRRKTVLEIYEHALGCKASVGLREAQRLQVIEDIREKRRDTIFNRLTELGFGEEIKQLNQIDPEILSEHALIKPAKDLTDRTWSNMKPVLIELMEDTREKILKKQRRSLFKKRQRVLIAVLRDYTLTRPATEVVPSTADICCMPLVKKIIEDTPFDKSVTPESFVDFLEQLPQLTEDWRQAKSRELLALLPSIGEGPLTDFWRLELATCYFQCSSCTEPISYPRILAHACMTALRHGYRNREDDLSLFFINVDSAPWNYDGDGIKYYDRAHGAAESVVRSCGLNAEIATADDLDAIDPWLECLSCSHRTRGRMVFRWRKAILHDMYHSLSEGSALWFLLDKDDAEIAKKQEKTTYLMQHSTSLDYYCVRCRERMTLSSVHDHIRYHHRVQEVNEEDYHLHIDASMDQPPFPLTIPYSKKPICIDITGDDDFPVEPLDELEYIDVPEYIVVED